MSKGLKLFITYAHKNSEAKDELITHLAVMKQNGLIDVWHDNEILPGDKWRDSIFNNLADSDILLYLTCPYSLASVNCNKELTAALDPNIRVIPIILEHCDWENHRLSEFQALPEKGKPIYDINEWNPESKGWMSVVKGLRKVVEEMPSNVQDETLPKWLLQQGNFLMMLKQVDRAVEAYTHAIELNSNYADAYNNRGVAYADKDQYELAINDYKVVIELAPVDFKAYNNRGNAYRAKKEFDLAINDYNTALDMEPDDAEVYNNRGCVYKDRHEYDRAIQDYNKALELKPNYVIAYYNRGNTYSQKEDIVSAIQDYNKAVDLDPKFAKAYAGRGETYNKKGEFDLAIEDYTKAVQFKPNYFEVYINRGAVFRKKGEFDLAIRDYTKVIELKPDLTQTYFNRGSTYVEKGEVEKAIKDYDMVIKYLPRFIDSYPEFAVSYYNRGMLWLRLENWEKAKSDLTNARNMGMDIIALFRDSFLSYSSITDFEQKHNVKLPEDIAAMLTPAQT